jgi:hypothetical protein
MAIGQLNLNTLFLLLLLRGLTFPAPSLLSCPATALILALVKARSEIKTEPAKEKKPASWGIVLLNFCKKLPKVKSKSGRKLFSILDTFRLWRIELRLYKF